MSDNNPAAEVERFAMQSESMIPVPSSTGYGEPEHVTMQVRNAPNGQRATRQVGTSGVHHIDVQAYPQALHVNLYSDKSAGWLFLRREMAAQLHRALGNALGINTRISEALDAIDNAYAYEYPEKSTDSIRQLLGIPVPEFIAAGAPDITVTE